MFCWFVIIIVTALSIFKVIFKPSENVLPNVKKIQKLVIIKIKLGVAIDA